MSDEANHTEQRDTGDEAEFSDAIEGEVEVLSEHAQRPGRQRLALLLAAAALLAVAGGLLFGYRYWTQLEQDLTRLDAALQQANQEQAALAQRLAQAQQEVERQQQAISAQEQALAEQHQRLLAAKQEAQQSGEQLYRSLTEIQTRLGGKETQWRIAEAEFLLRVANHRLTLMSDPATAQEALQSADDRLSATGDPGWAPVRDQIAREITSLSALPKVDVAGISAELSALAEQVDRLPLLNEGVSLTPKAPGEAAEPTPAASDEPTLQGMIDDLWRGLQSLLAIRRHDKPLSAMLPPEQRYFLMQNLRLKLQAAKAALLGRNQPLYQDNLNAAASWAATYFATDDPAVEGFRRQLDGLAKREVAPALPDISASLRALQERRRQLSRESTQ